MDRTPVNSSNIAAIGYDPDSQILEVEFLDGSIYDYSDVPDYHFEGIMAAPSKGQYLHQHIKKGGYTYQRVA